MKSLILSLTLSIVFTGVAEAAATLRIPVVIVGENEQPVNIQEINTQLKSKGVAEIPSSYQVSTEDVEKPYKTAQKISDLVETANESLGLQIMKSSSQVPAGNDTKSNLTCYTGEPAAVLELIQGLGDSEYSDQLGIHAWKYKKETHYVNVTEDDEEFLLEGSTTWREWRGNGEAILILSSIGDGGDDVQESLIKRCK